MVDFAVPDDHRVKLKETKKKKKEISTLTLLENWKKHEITMEHESDSDTNCNWCTRYSHQRFGTGTGGLGNKRKSGDHPSYNITEIGKNTKKGPGDVNRLAVTQCEKLSNDIDTTAAWKKPRFILSVRSDFHMTDILSIAVHAFVSQVWMSVSVDEILLPR